LSALLLAALLPCVFWTQGIESAPSLKTAGIERVCVPLGQVEAWRKAGFTASPMSEAELAERLTVAVPGIRARADRASATRSPWVNTNAWRFLREPKGEYVYEVPAGRAALAAAESYVYGATDVVLKIDPADVGGLGEMLSFLRGRPDDALPPVADIGVVDDGSAAMGEALNLLVRRNILFKLVPAPAPEFPFTVQLGTADFPAESAADPSAFALAVRRKLGDERRTLRVFGTEVVIGRLTGGGARWRLHLLNYAGRDIEGVRVRLKGVVPEGEALVPGGRLAFQDRTVVDGGTEFTVPRIGVYAVVDLPPAK
jgi:hypothetical protein